MSKLRTLAVTLITTLITLTSQADTYIKREMRSVWLTTVWAIDWPKTSGATNQKNEMIKYLDQLQADNFNTVFFQVRGLCDAMYESTWEPWHASLAGGRGNDPGWDPLAFVVEECHKRGMECHAWMNPFRYSSGGDQYSTANDNRMRENGWFLPGTVTPEYIVLNPAIAEVRDYITGVCEEVISKYDVDGIVFDDYFYPSGGTAENSSAGDYTMWKNSGTSMSIGDWRRNNVRLAVTQIYEMIQSVKPHVRFGISPAGVACTDWSVANKHGVPVCETTSSDWQYDEIYSDPVQWLIDGTIDYISPQIYWKSDGSNGPAFGPITEWWSKVADQFNRHHYSSHSITFVGSSNTTSSWAEVGKQVQLNRDYDVNGAPGQVYYSHNKIGGQTCSGLGEWLLANKYQAKSMVPAATWYETATYGKVSSISNSSGSLSWPSIIGDSYTYYNGKNYLFPTVRYSVYAIPTSVAKTAIMSTVTGGIESKYLLGISYTNSYTLPSDKRSGYYYAVCVLDRFGNEFEPRYSNDNISPATKVTLESPVGGAVVSSPATFSWSAAANATYRLIVSANSNFTSPVIDKSGLTTNSATVDIVDLGENKTYYWKVITSQANKEDTSSDSETFKTAEYPQLGAATLTTPANGSQVADLSTVTFKWNAISGASYQFQVASDKAFANILQSQDVTTNQATVAMSALKYNSTYYWRVIASSKGYKSSTSAVWSFLTPTREQAPAVQLVSPDNGASVTTAFNFVFSNSGADTYILEVATSATFKTIVLSANSGYNKSGSNYAYYVAESTLGSGTYYWRVRTQKAGCEETVSEVRSFTMDIPGAEDGYVIKKDPAFYSPSGDVEITNLWMRSSKSDFDNLPTNTDYGFNRSFCVIDNVIYVSGRMSNESTAEAYLDKYNALTGEYIEQITLNEDVQGRYAPCNDVMKDNAGNLLVSNMTLDVSSDPLRIHKVDKATGEVEEVASCTYSTSGRVDHCAVYGDVTSGNFTVFAGFSKTTTVVRWTFKNGQLSKSESKSFSTLYPTSADLNQNISIRMFPKSADEVYMNSAEQHPTLYNFATGKIIDSFKNATSVEPKSAYGNGCAFFPFLDAYYFIYPYNPVWKSNTSGAISGGPNDFCIASTDSSYSFDSLTSKWVVPADGLGEEYSFYADALIDAETEFNTDGSVKGVNIYFYIPTNGMAAYRLQKKGTSGGIGISQKVFKVWRQSNTVNMSNVGNIEVYNLSGIRVASAVNTNSISIESLEKGMYIIKCQSGRDSKVLKIVR